MNISEYLMTVVSASAIAVISDLVCSSYGKSGKGIEKYVKLAVSICVLACILIPEAKNFELENFILEAESSYTINEQDSLHILENETEQMLCEYIFSKTGIKPKDVSINMELKSDNSVKIKSAEIKISSNVTEDPEIIKETATEGLGTEVDVIYE